MDPLITPIVTAFFSFAGAWLATQLALRRFYREKVWERKTQAYGTIFAALHDMRLWYDNHLEAELTDKEIPEERKKELSQTHQKAKAELARHLDTEVWLIPDACRARLEHLMVQLDKHRDDWFDMVDTGSAEITKAINDLRAMVRTDLELESHEWYLRYMRRFQPKLPGSKTGA